MALTFAVPSRHGRVQNLSSPKRELETPMFLQRLVLQVTARTAIDVSVLVVQRLKSRRIARSFVVDVFSGVGESPKAHESYLYIDFDASRVDRYDSSLYEKSTTAT